MSDTQLYADFQAMFNGAAGQRIIQAMIRVANVPDAAVRCGRLDMVAYCLRMAAGEPEPMHVHRDMATMRTVALGPGSAEVSPR